MCLIYILITINLFVFKLKENSFNAPTLMCCLVKYVVRILFWNLDPVCCEMTVCPGIGSRKFVPYTETRFNQLLYLRKTSKLGLFNKKKTYTETRIRFLTLIKKLKRKRNQHQYFCWNLNVIKDLKPSF